MTKDRDDSKSCVIHSIIEELEQEPTAKNDLGVDCISRAQTQTEIEMNAYRYTLAKERGGIGQVEWSDHLIKVSDAVDIIRKLPPVTPQEPRWVPVTERLPEEDGGYLVTVKRGYVTTALWVGNTKHWNEVTAWMPLPEPYKEVKK